MISRTLTLVETSQNRDQLFHDLEILRRRSAVGMLNNHDRMQDTRAENCSGYSWTVRELFANSSRKVITPKDTPPRVSRIPVLLAGSRTNGTGARFGYHSRWQNARALSPRLCDARVARLRRLLVTLQHVKNNS